MAIEGIKQVVIRLSTSRLDGQCVTGNSERDALYRRELICSLEQFTAATPKFVKLLTVARVVAVGVGGACLLAHLPPHGCACLCL